MSQDIPVDGRDKLAGGAARSWKRGGNNVSTRVTIVIIHTAANNTANFNGKGAARNFLRTSAFGDRSCSIAENMDTLLWSTQVQKYENIFGVVTVVNLIPSKTQSSVVSN